MHKWAKEIMECVKGKINARGLDNIQREELEELKCWSEVAKNISEYDYYFHITEEMEKSEKEEDSKYYTQPRNSRGEFRRRGYEPSMSRDMDESMGRMYYYDGNRMGYDESNRMGYGNGNSNRGYDEKPMKPDDNKWR